jgi:hypothetical protein
MSFKVAEILREQTRRVLAIAERAVVTEVKRELGSVAAVLAQLAEKLERDGRGDEG